MKRKHTSVTQEEDSETYNTDSEETPWRSSEDTRTGCHVSIRRRRIDSTELTPKQLTRIMKNRQAAQASRDRKKNYVTELEASKEQLETEAVTLRHRVEILETEKCSLSSQVCQLKSEFEQLRALILGRNASFSADQLVDEQLLSNKPSVPQSPSSSVVELDIRMDLRPTATPATTVPPATSSPSIIIVDHQPTLGSRRATMPPLSVQNHCLRTLQPQRHMLTGRMARRLLALRQQLQSRKQKLAFAASVAPLTLRLLKARQRNQTTRPRTGSLTPTFTDNPRLKRSFGSTTTLLPRTRLRIRQMQRSAKSSTWSRRMSISDLMNLLISKYQPKQ